MSFQAAEGALFATYVTRGARVLDLGVGAGRATPALAEMAGSYLGIDYSEEMVEHCRRTFPAHRFEVGDARKLVALRDGTFDVVVVRAAGALASEGPLHLALEGATAALREGGRCELIADSSPERGPMLVTLLGDAGFRGSRVLTDRGGLLYVEAVKRRG